MFKDQETGSDQFPPFCNGCQCLLPLRLLWFVRTTIIKLRDGDTLNWGGTEMKELDQITKLWLRLQDSMEWSRRVKIAGNRILDYVPTFSHAGKKLDVWEDPGMKYAMNYVTVSANMKSEIYFFIVSFANYLKALDRLRIKIDIEKFEDTRELIKALKISMNIGNSMISENGKKAN